MHDPRDISDRPSVYARAEPDDEYDRRPDPLDPYLIERNESEEYNFDDIEDDEDELDEDET